ncbi:MAG: CHASE2 domain-containing protein [Dissulfurispiraceae bacterium]|jgi:signal transduction histidine kinase/CHASE2 domain-containing sensor protein|nr:CHASE2 domain-containing protein [Dissulfurispiraceae bacterium]
MNRAKKNLLNSVVAITAALSVIFILELIGAFNVIDLFFYDLNFRLRGVQSRSSDIVIAAIDEKTLAKYGKWPIPRSYYAKLLARTAAAKAVGFDIIWSEPSADDNILATAVQHHGRVVLPAYVGSEIIPVVPLDIFNPESSGHVHVDQDIDGKVRQIYHSIYLNGHTYSSFAASVFEVATGQRVQRRVMALRQSEISLNVLYQHNPMQINFFGPLGSFQKVSFYEVVEGLYPVSYFKDKIVLVGLTAEAMQARFFTPISDKRGGMSSVELHANILNNLLLDNSIYIVPELFRFIAGLFFMAVIFSLCMRINEMHSLLILFLAIGAIFVASYMFFAHFNVWLKASLFYAGAIAAFCASYMVKLDQAAAMLNQEYSDIAAHLGTAHDETGSGIMGLLSAGGINAKVEMADKLARELLFEKALADAVISNSMSGILLFESGGSLVIANENARRIAQVLALDLSDLERFTNSLLDPVMGSSSSMQKLKTLSDHGQTVTFTLCSGADFFAKTDAVIMSFENEKYLLFLMTDITEIKKLEILKNEMVSLISHELRTPLTSIQGYANILEMNVDESQKQYISVISQESDRMNRLISTYLDLSHLESGDRLIKKTEIDVRLFVHSVIMSVEPFARKKNITINSDISDALPLVMLDEDLLRQCMINILENAIKYSPEGSAVFINVSIDSNNLVLTVADHGVGMDSATLAKIFDKFYRAHSYTDADAAGYGLGLAFVKHASELLGGSIYAESVPGKGSVFTMKIPLNMID